MNASKSIVTQPAVVIGLSIALFALLIPLGFSGLLVYQTGIYPNAHVVRNSGLNVDFVCRVPNCAWEMSLSTRTTLTSADSLVLVSDWQRNHRLRGSNRWGPFTVAYRLGDYDPLMCMCPRSYVTFSSLELAYTP